GSLAPTSFGRCRLHHPFAASPRPNSVQRLFEAASHYDCPVCSVVACRHTRGRNTGRRQSQTPFLRRRVACFRSRTRRNRGLEGGGGQSLGADRSDHSSHLVVTA